MREQFYIDQERMEEARRRWAEEAKYPPPVSLDEKLEYSGFEPFNFPDREGQPVVRRRTRAQIRELLEWGNTHGR